MYYYVGINEKYIQDIDFFYGSITIIGSNRNNNFSYDKIYNKIIDYNDINSIDEISAFYSCCMKKIIESDSEAKFMFYSLMDTTKLDKKVIKHIICNNSNEILYLLNNKIFCREFLKESIKLLDYYYLKGKDIDHKQIKEMLNEKEQLVVQQPMGFSGFGTYRITNKNCNHIVNLLQKEVTYSISKYIENNIPINNTFIIFEDEILIFDGSVQRIQVGDELIYDGFDFEEYNKFSDYLKEKVKKQTLKICEKLQKIGYRGIGGVDYIIVDDELYFMEINPRFQASTARLNELITSRGESSIYELNVKSFNNK